MIVIILMSTWAVPFLASADLIITKIVYDPPGADAGREWIELLNTGTSSVRLIDLKLHTSGVNHNITALSGDGVLASQAYAAIVQDQSAFAQDNPGFAGTIFRASFSLTNKSGTIDIVDKSGVVIASKSYQAPAPIPASSKPSIVRADSQKTKKPKSPTFTEKSDFSTTNDPSTDTDARTNSPQAALSAQAGAVSEAGSGNSPLWWMGTIALAGFAGIATFASRRIAKCEWDIIEEKEE